jgi:hypothetical protein
LRNSLLAQRTSSHGISRACAHEAWRSAPAAGYFTILSKNAAAWPDAVAMTLQE